MAIAQGASYLDYETMDPEQISMRLAHAGKPKKGALYNKAHKKNVVCTILLAFPRRIH